MTIEEERLIEGLDNYLYKNGIDEKFMECVNRLIKTNNGREILKHIFAVETFNLPVDILLKIYQCDSLEDLTDLICESEDPRQICYYAKNIDNVDKNKLTNAICKFKKPLCLYDFLHDTKNLSEENKKKLIDAIIGTKSAKYICDTARIVKGLDLDKLTDAICETNSPLYIYEFARHVDKLGATNLNKLNNAICKTKNALCIYYFAGEVEGANITQLTDAICETGDAQYICCFAEKIEEANKTKLSEGIVKTLDASYIYYFATEIKGADIDVLLKGMLKTNNMLYTFLLGNKFIISDEQLRNKYVDAICNSGDASYIYEFATGSNSKYFSQENIDKLTNAICETGEASDIYLFTLKVNGANLEKLSEAIVKTKDFRCISMFVREVKYIDVNKLAEKICELEIDDASGIYSFIFETGNNLSYKIFEKLALIIFKIGDADYIEAILRNFNFEVSFIDKTIDSICLSGNAESIYNFSYYFIKNGADIDRLTEAICKTQDAEYIYKFAKYVEGADIDKLKSALEEIGDDITYKN